MNDIALRIKELIEKQDLSNKEFAKRLSINPSIISHILSGRNKVSLQVVEQIVKEFTNVSLDYLLLGSGSIFKEVTNVNYNSSLVDNSEKPPTEEKSAENIAPALEIITSQEEKNPISEIKTPTKKKEINPLLDQNSELKIDQVIIFYADGSFKIYKP